MANMFVRLYLLLPKRCYEHNRGKLIVLQYYSGRYLFMISTFSRQSTFTPMGFVDIWVPFCKF